MFGYMTEIESVDIIMEDTVEAEGNCVYPVNQPINQSINRTNDHMMDCILSNQSINRAFIRQSIS